MYMPKQPSGSENGSVSSNLDEPGTPNGKQTTPLPFQPITTLSVNSESSFIDVMSESPLYQLQLKSVQASPTMR